MVKIYKDWCEYLHFALWGYRTTMRTTTGQTPFSLVYGCEVVLPIKIEIKSLRVVMEAKTLENEWERKRYDHLVSLDEKRMDALFHTQITQRRLARAFNKKVKPEKIKAGNMVLKQSRVIVFDPRGKFRSNWEGPYLVKIVLPKGATRISDLEWNEFTEPVNLDHLKKYYL